MADGQPMSLRARAFDVLQALIERRERLITKNELLDLVWPGVVVEENNLQVQISTLRKLLGPLAIATISGRGGCTRGARSTGVVNRSGKSVDVLRFIALRLALLGRCEDAARLLGFADDAHLKGSQVREVNEQRLRVRLLSLLRTRFEEAEL